MSRFPGKHLHARLLPRGMPLQASGGSSTLGHQRERLTTDALQVRQGSSETRLHDGLLRGGSVPVHGSRSAVATESANFAAATPAPAAAELTSAVAAGSADSAASPAAAAASTGDPRALARGAHHGSDLWHLRGPHHRPGNLLPCCRRDVLPSSRALRPLLSTCLLCH